MANCEQWREPISAYADGECGWAERKQVEAHLRECADCQRWLEKICADQQLFTETMMGREADISERVLKRVGQMSAAKSQPVQERKASVRRCTAEAAVGAVGALAVICVLTVVFFPVFARSKAKAHQTQCLSNVKQLTLAMLMYADDHDGRLPNALTWADDLPPYVGNDEVFRCPLDKSGQAVSYTMVRRWSGAKLEDIPAPAYTIIICDGLHGRPDLRHQGGVNAGYADGHAKWIGELPSNVTSTTALAPEALDRNYGMQRELKLAYDAALEVWVENVQEAMVAAEQTFYERGGLVLSSALNQAGGRTEMRYAEIVGKVPTEEVANTINELAALGYVARREILGEDITDQYIQTTREITQIKEGVQELRERRPRASRAAKRQIDQKIAAAKRELGPAQDEYFDVQRELALATIQATLVEKTLEVSEALPGVRGAWRSFARAAGKVGVALIWVGLYGLFFLPIIAGIIMYRRWRQ